jgi:cytochrome c oxidase subunit 2
MIGSVIVMDPSAYQAWLSGGGEGTLAERGAALFGQLACSTCHLDDGQGRGPSLKNIFGRPVELADGSKVIVDEAYLRESILTSQAKVVKGYQPLMPTFQGLISEEGLVALIEHVRSLSPTASTAAGAAAPPAAGQTPEAGSASGGAPTPRARGRQ